MLSNTLVRENQHNVTLRTMFYKLKIKAFLNTLYYEFLN